VKLTEAYEAIERSAKITLAKMINSMCYCAVASHPRRLTIEKHHGQIFERCPRYRDKGAINEVQIILRVISGPVRT
jgi:hypothetical protein